MMIDGVVISKLSAKSYVYTVKTCFGEIISGVPFNGRGQSFETGQRVALFDACAQSFGGVAFAKVPEANKATAIQQAPARTALMYIASRAGNARRRYATAELLRIQGERFIFGGANCEKDIICDLENVRPGDIVIIQVDPLPARAVGFAWLAEDIDDQVLEDLSKKDVNHICSENGRFSPDEYVFYPQTTIDYALAAHSFFSNRVSFSTYRYDRINGTYTELLRKYSSAKSALTDRATIEVLPVDESKAFFYTRIVERNFSGSVQFIYYAKWRRNELAYTEITEAEYFANADITTIKTANDKFWWQELGNVLISDAIDGTKTQIIPSAYDPNRESAWPLRTVSYWEA